MSTAAEAAAWFGTLARDLPLTIEETVTAALDELIRQLEPVTPVVTGRMKAGYTIGTTGAGDLLELINTAEASDGDPYPRTVFDDPNWSRSYGILNATLDAGITALEADLDAAITALTLRPF